MTPDITVITITRLRPALLQRAIQSVQGQLCDKIEHLVLVDECAETREMLQSTELPANVTWHWMERTPGEQSGPGRSARLRNYGVRIARAPWIAYLDDDNEWLPDHLAALRRRADETGVRAVHSHRMLLNRDGSPYLEPFMPWSRDRHKAEARYKALCDKGVMTPGSNIMKDRADPIDHPDPVRAVDTGSWLLARDLLLEVPFRDRFSDTDEINIVGEDDKLLADLILRQEPIACSNLPTLVYYLGGYSNNYDTQFDPTFAWRTE